MNGHNWDDDGAQEGLMTRRSSSACLTEKEMEDFLFDRLSGVTRETVEEHLLYCHACLDRIEAEELNIGTFRDATGQIELEELEANYASPVQPAELKKPGLLGILAKWLFPLSGFTWKPALGAATLLALLAIALPRFTANQPYVNVALRTVRGDSATEGAAAPASRPVRLQIDTTELDSLPQYAAELADANGNIVRSAQLAPQSGRLSWAIKSPAAGQYWVRLLKPGSPPTLLREFSFVAK